GRKTTGLESEKAVATPANAFSAPGPYCIAKTPGGRPFDTREKPSAMCTPTRSWRQMTGLMPTAAAASIIGVVGKQKRFETPSFFRISAMTFMTSIGRSSRRIALLDEIECSFIDVGRQAGGDNANMASPTLSVSFPC